MSGDGLLTLLDRLAEEEANRIRAKQTGPQPGVQEDCDICGHVEKGCFGFGCSRTRRGVWSCFDPDCRAEAEARSRLGNTSPSARMVAA